MASRCHSRPLLALAYIERYRDEYHSSPSFKEIAAELSVPVQRVGRILDELEAKGQIVRDRGTPRSIRLADSPKSIDEARLLLQRQGWTVLPPINDPLVEPKV